jgi:prepilin-type N-terminal cleavage/methylation domain-containing protein
VHYDIDYATCCLSYADYRRAHTDNVLKDKIMLQHCHKHSGFSLAELMIVVAIFGIIATVAAPNFQAWSRNYQLKSAANDLYSHMQMAKLGAVKANRPWTLNFNPDGMLGYTISYIDDITNITKTVKKVDFHSKYNQEIQFKNPTSSILFDNATLIFNPNGTVVAGNPSKFPVFAYVSNNARSGYYRVGLPSSYGAIIVEKWNGSGWK